MASTRVAVVTGCSRGVGLAMVPELARRHYKVFATCRDPTSASQLTALLTSLGQPPPVQLDVTDESSLQAAVRTISSATERVDLLINNAGIATRNHPVDPAVSAEPAEMIRVFTTNVAGVVRTTQLLLPLLRAAEAPRVVNISSGLASITRCMQPNPGIPGAGRVISYRASKAALNMATVTMAQEIPEVRFLLVHPGWVQTDMGGAGGRTADIDVATSAAGVVAVATDAQLPQEMFVDYLGKPIPW